MNKTIEVTGKTENAAIASALEELGLSRDEVSIEIIERAKPGFLGLGASPAKIRITYECEEDMIGSVRNFLNGLLSRMGSEATAEVAQDADGNITANLAGEGLGSLIGRRGETLDAIQHLANYAVNRAGDERVRVSVDAENYRSKREESLTRLAEKVAGKVLRYRKNITLEPMNSYERHVIHAALQEKSGISTYSVGSEPNRRVVVAYGSGKSEGQFKRR